MGRDMQVSAGCVHDIGLHVVWCPKYRRPVLDGPVASRLRELIDAKAAEHGWQVVACEIVPDHVHLFVKTSPKDSPAFVANQFKGASSRALRQGRRPCQGPSASRRAGPGQRGQEHLRQGRAGLWSGSRSLRS
jgi:REP element-mobilizing transposase RayT